MTEDIGPEVVKKTQDTLGKFIKKPVLTEKLLKKPPFRFLHDICTAAMKETGFFEGVLSVNDVKPDNIKDKDGKIAFLQKVIAAVESANDIKLTVRPNKIVAGHEANKTNEFLQALAVALEKQIENKPPKQSLRKSKTQKSDIKDDEAVRRKNATNKTMQKAAEPATNTEVPKKEVSKRRSGEKKMEVENKRGLKTDKAPKETKKSSKEPKASESNKENGDLVNGHHEELKSSEVLVESAKKDDPFGEEVKERRVKSTRKQRKDAEEPLDRKNTPPQQDDRNGDARDRIRSGTVSNEQATVQKHSPPPEASAPPETPPVATLVSPPLDAASVASATAATESAATDTLVSRSAVVATPVNGSSATAAAPIPNSRGPSAVPSAAGAPVKKEEDGGFVSRPRTAIRAPTARPASARPAAPRIRDRGQVQLQEEILKPAAGKVNVIVEQDAAQVDDDDLVLVQGSQEADVAEEPLLPRPPDGEEADHGLLVSQILESQKKLEEDALPGSKPGRTEIEWETTRSADVTTREVERLRMSIQALTRSANPLGKLLEFLQDDVDTMQQELNTWRDSNTKLAAKLQKERSLTEQSTEPLRIHLNELQVSIDQQLEQTAALKATVIRNDEKITSLLASL